VARLGIEVYVTELDVSDALLPDDGRRAEGVALFLAQFLDAVLAEPAVRGIVTWGLSDKYSWLNTSSAGELSRADGKTTLGLPLDEAMRRTPVWAALADAMDARTIGYNSDGRLNPDRQG
jgi:endo-1,4-beta-xylanase